ncbi:RsmB/NOP family class I SAM-dependent RNA methyltransferase [Ignicoccus hospitalis]|uniref:Ribosomal RNA methyltransferase NOP2 n=1 Tax=Ignicoccus hospitalis (strain KIN4/I / DSM 18386 / JCM 14125) TaxID=453591 RepID=A8A8J9_IGNH4|nr:RsmB/NOP family class I SAM-dependent RNA methyltransferase [Ignicoccus hospitalis]ABU81251.1 ribosomal RNA methyltransferase NOP2 [Ignicoccus hospitalis KIN4/I]HIH90933.1 RsmB/NOP family class I SAM-dependent RNA methyltransferase [Desulfurococcaceae archaeon]
MKHQEILKKLKDLKITKEDKLLARKYGYLPYMVRRYREMLGDPLPLLEAFEVPPKPTIRCNFLKVGCGKLKERLESRGFVLKQVLWCPHAYEVLREPFSLSSTPEHLDGWFYIQDKASTLPPLVLGPKPGETVADLASAPGGKATHLAQLMGNSGRLILIERRRDRAKALMSNLERMEILNANVIIDDAYNASKYGPFDKALLDAPCTGEGVIARDPSRKRSRRPEDLALMHKVQAMLLNRALDSLKPGGELVYSTCSIAPEENELVIETILKTRDDVEVLDGGEAGSPGIEEYLGWEFPFAYKCRRLWPHVHGSEGFFVCKLRKL